MRKLFCAIGMLLFLFGWSTKAQTQGASGSVQFPPVIFGNMTLNMSGTQCLQAVNGFVLGTGAPCLNFVASAVNAVGLTATPTATANPNNLTMEIGGVYTGNAASATQLATVPQVCPAGQYASGISSNGNAVCQPFPAPVSIFSIAPGSVGQFNQTGIVPNNPSGNAMTLTAETVYVFPTNMPASETVTAIELSYATNTAVAGTADAGLYQFSLIGTVNVVAHCNHGGISTSNTAFNFNNCSLSPVVSVSPGTYLGAVCASQATTSFSTVNSLIAPNQAIRPKTWGTDSVDVCVNGILPASINMANVVANVGVAPIYFRLVP